MKKIFYLLSISFLLLQACSTGGSNNSNTSSNDDNSLLMRKWYDNCCHCSNGNRDYYEFLSPNIFRHYVYPTNLDCNYILPEYGTFTRNGNTIVLKYNPSLGITDAILTIETLTASTFSFVATGAFGGHYVLTSY